MFSPVTTPEAIENYVKWKTIIRNHQEGFISRDERELRSEFARHIDAADAAIAGTPGVFTQLLKDTLPYWQKYVDHSKSDGFSKWFMEKLFGRWNYKTSQLFHNLARFYELNYQVADEIVWAKAARVDQYLQMGGPSYFVVESLYDGNFAVEDVRWFLDHQSRHYIPSAYRALSKGFTPQLMRKVGSKVYIRYSPAFANRMVQKARPALLGSLAALETPGRQVLTEEHLEALIDAGFTSQKEVRDYARTFGISWVDQNFYTRVANAKTLYPVLADYVPVV